MAISFGVCSIYKYEGDIPDNIHDIFYNKVFIEKSAEFMRYDSGKKEIDYNELRKDEFGNNIKYHKLNKCKALLMSGGLDSSRNTKDDLIEEVNCYCF